MASMIFRRHFGLARIALRLACVGAIAWNAAAASAETTELASLQPGASGLAPASAGQHLASLQSPEALMQAGLEQERLGEYAAAARLYKQAGDAGLAPASQRLGELLLQGANGVHRDYVASVHWYAKAREQGLDIQGPMKRF